MENNLVEISGNNFLEELMSRMKSGKIRYAIQRNQQTNNWEMIIEETETGSKITVDITGMRGENGSEIRWFNVFTKS